MLLALAAHFDDDGHLPAHVQDTTPHPFSDPGAGLDASDAGQELFLEWVGVVIALLVGGAVCAGAGMACCSLQLNQGPQSLKGTRPLVILSCCPVGLGMAGTLVLDILTSSRSAIILLTTSPWWMGPSSPAGCVSMWAVSASSRCWPGS